MQLDLIDSVKSSLSWNLDLFMHKCPGLDANPYA